MNTGSLVQQCEAYADTLAEAVLNVIDCWFRPAMFDARLEFAVRSWALQAPPLQAEIWAADEVRTEAIRALLVRFGMPFQTADVRARAIYLTQIGYIAMRVVEEMPVRMRRIPDYVALYTGVAPTEREMNRFFARIGFDAAPRPASNWPANWPLRRAGDPPWRGHGDAHGGRAVSPAEPSSRFC